MIRIFDEIGESPKQELRKRQYCLGTIRCWVEVKGDYSIFHSNYYDYDNNIIKVEIKKVYNPSIKLK